MNKAFEHVEGSFTVVVVIVETLTGEERDDGLAHHMFVPAVYLFGAATIGRIPRVAEMVPHHRGERLLLHAVLDLDFSLDHVLVLHFPRTALVNAKCTAG